MLNDTIETLKAQVAQLQSDYAAVVAAKDSLQAKDNARSSQLLSLASTLGFLSVPSLDDLNAHVRHMQKRLSGLTKLAKAVCETMTIPASSDPADVSQSVRRVIPGLQDKALKLGQVCDLLGCADEADVVQHAKASAEARRDLAMLDREARVQERPQLDAIARRLGFLHTPSLDDMLADIDKMKTATLDNALWVDRTLASIGANGREAAHNILRAKDARQAELESLMTSVLTIFGLGKDRMSVMALIERLKSINTSKLVMDEALSKIRRAFGLHDTCGLSVIIEHAEELQSAVEAAAAAAKVPVDPDVKPELVAVITRGLSDWAAIEQLFKVCGFNGMRDTATLIQHVKDMVAAAKLSTVLNARETLGQLARALEIPEDEVTIEKAIIAIAGLQNSRANAQHWLTQIREITHTTEKHAEATVSAVLKLTSDLREATDGIGRIREEVNGAGSEAFALKPGCTADALVRRISELHGRYKHSEHEKDTLLRVLGEITRECDVKPEGALMYHEDATWTSRVLLRIKTQLGHDRQDEIQRLTVKARGLEADVSELRLRNDRIRERAEALQTMLNDRTFPTGSRIVPVDATRFTVVAP